MRSRRPRFSPPTATPRSAGARSSRRRWIRRRARSGRAPARDLHPASPRRRLRRPARPALRRPARGAHDRFSPERHVLRRDDLAAAGRSRLRDSRQLADRRRRNCPARPRDLTEAGAASRWSRRWSRWPSRRSRSPRSGVSAAGSFRSARHVERHLAEIETTEAIIAALPGRDRLADAALSGETGGYRWRLESAPFRADFVDPRARTPWTPQRIVLSVQGPTGEVVSFDMIRLVRTPAR